MPRVVREGLSPRVGVPSEARPGTSTPRASGSPVAAMMIDWFGSLLRPNTAIEPTLIPSVGPASVKGT